MNRHTLALGMLLMAGLLSACPSENSESTTSTSSETSTSTTTGQSPAADAASPAAADAGDGIGIGHVKSVTLAALDPAIAAEGKKLFEAKCTACHKVTPDKYVGPGLKGVTQRRKPEWIMNMIINPTEMTQKDPEAKKLFAQYMIQMTNQNVDEKQARALLEYFRQVDGG